MLAKWRRLLTSEIFLAFADSVALAAAEDKVFTVPARLLVELPNYKIIAFGREAREVEHAGVGQSKIIVPCNDNEVFDERGAEVFLRGLFRTLLGSGFLLKPRIWFALPGRTTPFMREVWTAVVLSAGARDVVLVNPLLAVAVGAGLPSKEGHGYATGVVTEEGVALGLVAFGHVQREVWKPAVPQSGVANPGLEALHQAWRELLQRLPAEFSGSLQREGLVLAVPDDSAEWSKAYADVVGVPVTTVDHSTVVGGLRRLAKEERA